MRHKPVPYFTGKHEFVAMVVTNDQRVQRVVWSVSADHERLRLVHLVLEPRAGALAGLVTGVFTLCDYASKLNSFTSGINSAGVASIVSDKHMSGVLGLRSLMTSASSSRLVSSGT